MDTPNRTQIEHWNGRAGAKWAAHQTDLDAMLADATAELKTRVGDVAGQRVLDVGCGTGETCALWLAGGAHVTGVDVSAPMLAVAASRLRGAATLVEADASTWRGAAPFDVAVSRFGVMFFSAPESAFANIAANLRERGRLVFVCWRALRENAWAAVPLAAIRELLPPAPPPPPDAPGTFAFADEQRVRAILQSAGFGAITIRPFDFAVRLAAEGGVDAAVRFTLQLGPAGAALAEVTPETRALAAERLTTALRAHERDGRVSLAGAAWVVEAVRSAPR